jgi:NitT/TauT family transport system permease protein
LTVLDAPSPGAAAPPAPPRATTPRRRGRLRGDPRFAVISAALALVVWQLLVVFGNVPKYMLPAPADVLAALWEGLTLPFSDREAYLPHIWYTISAALMGFGLGAGAGVLLGAFCAMNRVVNQLVRPYVFGLQSMPKIALTPLLMVWLGFGDPTKIALAALLVFFPVFVNAYTGLVNLDQSYVRLFQGLRANRWQTFMQLRLPIALVPMFAGFEMGIVRAQLGAVIAEFLAGQDGVGILLIRFQYVNNTAGVFAVFLLLAVTSTLLYQLVKVIRQRLIFWAPSVKDAR